MATSRVFFISESHRFDYSTAEEFGTPVFLLRDREVSPFNVDLLVERIEQTLLENAFDIAVDYIAITGPSAMVALFLGYLGSLRQPLKLLMFNAAQGKYQSRILDASQTAHAPAREEG